MKAWMLAAALALTPAAGLAQAALPPAAIFTDPPVDTAHPARMEVLHIPSSGVEINGIAYLAVGAGAPPPGGLFPGRPGNEKNLDLAQAIRRAGWNVITINYRGSWGSPGTFSFRGNLADAKATLAYVRANAGKLQVETTKLVVMGHSMGGWVTAMTGGSDPDLAGAVMISAANMGALALAPEAQRLNTARSNMETLAGVTPQSMAQEMTTLADASFAAAAPGLARKPLLILTSDDGLGPMGEALFMDVKQRGGRVAIIHAATDQGWNSARIRLETEVLTWLAKLP